MNTVLIAAALPFIPVSTMAQTANGGALAQRVQRIEDRTALKHLVDTFSNLADQKDVQKQLLLFTEDATVESITDGKSSSVLKGREQIGKAFAAYLANFETVYHINGQQTLDLRGDTAAGVLYCLVVLIGLRTARGSGTRVACTTTMSMYVGATPGSSPSGSHISHGATRKRCRSRRPDGCGLRCAARTIVRRASGSDGWVFRPASEMPWRGDG
jgi:ketosteroid isomerase-like protein